MSQNVRDFSRRQFLSQGAAGASMAGLGVMTDFSGYLRTDSKAAQEDYSRYLIQDQSVKKLAETAVSIARQLGADYSDVRLTRTVVQTVSGDLVGDREEFGFGVRARVNGSWGFAASPYWSEQEARILSENAVEQAKYNSLGFNQPVQLAPIKVVTGHWVTPVKYDPFDIPMEEKIDHSRAWASQIASYRNGINTMLSMQFNRQERAVATSDGSYFTQVVYQSGGSLNVDVKNRNPRNNKGHIAPVAGLDMACQGWERWLEADIMEQIPEMVEYADMFMALPIVPVSIGRYDVVFDAVSSAGMINSTLSMATELDRAMGTEANSTGVGLLGPDPIEKLGNFAIGSKMLNLSANRTSPTGLSTVKWDDEGVEQHEWALVENGVVVDYQTTRDQAESLQNWYSERNIEFKSHGCAAAQSAMYITIQHPPNFTMGIGADNKKFDDLVLDVKNGIAISGASVSTDHQGMSGSGTGVMREIRNGKLGAVIAGGGFLFDTVGFWNGLKSIGGAASSIDIPFSRPKGQPEQSSMYTVSAAPMIIGELGIYDRSRTP